LEAMPVTGSGKVLKTALRASVATQLRQRRAAQIAAAAPNAGVVAAAAGPAPDAAAAARAIAAALGDGCKEWHAYEGYEAFHIEFGYALLPAAGQPWRLQVLRRPRPRSNPLSRFFSVQGMRTRSLSQHLPGQALPWIDCSGKEAAGAHHDSERTQRGLVTETNRIQCVVFLNAK
jgi:hypothetical protein